VKEDQAERAQLAQWKQEEKSLHAKIRNDEKKLASDRKEFGPNSAQVQSDSAQLKSDEQALAGLRQQIHSLLREEAREEGKEKPPHHGAWAKAGVTPHPRH